MTNEVNSLRNADRLVKKLIKLNSATVSTLAEELEMPLSTVYDYVRTLESMGYLTKLPSKQYKVSTYFLEIGNKIRHQKNIYTIAKPKLQKLAIETGEYVVLMIEENNLGVILSMKRGEKASNVNIQRTYAGTKTRLNTTATGKAILSELKKDQIQSIVEEYGLSSKTSNTIIEEEELYEELARIQDLGYAIDDEERFEGMRGIGVPVVSEPDDVVAAIGLYGPTNRFTDSMLQNELPQQVLEVANIIQVNLTYS